MGDEGYFDWHASMRYTNKRVNDKYRPCSKRQGDSRKKTTFYVFRQNEEATYLGNVEFPLMSQKGLSKGSYQPVMRSRMKASTPLASQ
ncbi:hypothetical protein CK203_107433 [Vitis vinifera]|uniref:Uncharacterized protein n=1 Tax=Vitis vinifera TaxID=29760 RepID=A0A438FHW4_VITVI|nr:hypothetical protein CK203_107433 [Vitis vinifera]